MEMEFLAVRPRLIARGFPHPDPDTGKYDLKAIDIWMDNQSGLTGASTSRDVSSLVAGRLGLLHGRMREE
jgi:hypothetical protein